MKKHNKIFLSFLLMLAVFIAMPASVFAQEADKLDLTKKGRLGIVLESEKDKTPVSDVDVTLYRVADVKIENGTLKYDFTESFSGYSKTLDDVKSLETAKKLFQYALDHRIKGETKLTNEKGRTEFADLQTGVYLVSETKGNDMYESFLPFLAVLPYDNQGKWEFNLLAKPKFGDFGADTGMDMDITVKKIWNDDGNHRPPSIVAELLCGDEVRDTVELNEENGWTHQWTKLDSQKQWSVREREVPADYTVTYTKNGNEYIISNTRALVQTGQLRWPIPVLAVGGMVLITIGIMIRFRKKTNE